MGPDVSQVSPIQDRSRSKILRQTQEIRHDVHRKDSSNDEVTSGSACVMIDRADGGSWMDVGMKEC